MERLTVSHIKSNVSIHRKSLELMAAERSEKMFSHSPPSETIVIQNPTL